MATGGEPSSTIGDCKGSGDMYDVVDYKGSEEVFDFTCTPCEEDGKNVEAVKFCVDCSQYFCAACTNHHRKFGVTSGHNVVKADEADQASSMLPTSTGYQQHSGATSLHSVVKSSVKDQSSPMMQPYTNHQQNPGVTPGHGVSEIYHSSVLPPVYTNYYQSPGFTYGHNVVSPYQLSPVPPAFTNYHQSPVTVYQSNPSSAMLPPNINQRQNVGAAQQNQPSALLPTKRCRDHVGERISGYCTEHDVAVCSTCVALDHRSCRVEDYTPRNGGDQDPLEQMLQIDRRITQYWHKNWRVIAAVAVVVIIIIIFIPMIS